jgi:ABC-type dipeptide/oligopeptide/nickel transport system permease component
MLTYLVGRLISAAITLVVVSVVVFVVARLTGDPVRLMLPIEASTQEVERVRQQLGFDQPLPIQYLQFASRAIQGDLGTSLRYRQPAFDVIVGRLPATAALAAAAMAIALAIAIPSGIVSAVGRGGVLDGLARGLSLLGQALPAYWLGIMLIIVFAIWLHWLPAAGAGTPAHVILPAITLGLWPTARISRVLRASLLESLNGDYVRTARAKGLAESRVVVRHALANALLPAVTVVGLSFGIVFGGAIITETVFAWPGVGRLLLDAVSQRDYPLVQAIVLMFAVVFLLINLGVDLLYGVLDPRVRLA